jgi:hypothetical protein
MTTGRSEWYRFGGCGFEILGAGLMLSRSILRSRLGGAPASTLHVIATPGRMWIAMSGLGLSRGRGGRRGFVTEYGVPPGFGGGAEMGGEDFAISEMLMVRSGA